MADNSVNTTDSGEEPAGSNLALALIIGLPSVAVIIMLVVVMSVMLWLTLKTNRSRHDVEAMYIRRRFQGLTLEEQAKMERRRKKRVLIRRRSSAAESRTSSQLSESMRRAKIRRANPFSLQDWQLKLSGIELGETNTEETDIDDEDDEGHMYNRKPIGAINPLLMHGDIDAFGHSEAVTRQPSRHKPHQAEASNTTTTAAVFTGGRGGQWGSRQTHGKQHQAEANTAVAAGRGSRELAVKVAIGRDGQRVKVVGKTLEESSEDESSSSDDSFNPYDA